MRPISVPSAIASEMPSADQAAALLADAIGAVERVDQRARRAAGRDHRDDDASRRAGDRARCCERFGLALELIAEELDDLGGQHLLEARAGAGGSRTDRRPGRRSTTTAASGGTTARIANSAVPAARIGISPSSASRPRGASARSATRWCATSAARLARSSSHAILHCVPQALIDTHCHLDAAAFDADRDGGRCARAAAAGVRAMLVPAIRPRDVAGAACDGAGGRVRHRARHPSAGRAGARCRRGDWRSRRRDRARGHRGRRAVAVGECGLDGATGDARAPGAAPARARAGARGWSGGRSSIHVLRAHDAAPRILREERVHEVGGVMHSYSGGADLVPVYRDLGLSLLVRRPGDLPQRAQAARGRPRGARRAAARRDRCARPVAARRGAQRAGLRRGCRSPRWPRARASFPRGDRRPDDEERMPAVRAFRHNAPP